MGGRNLTVDRLRVLIGVYSNSINEIREMAFGKAFSLCSLEIIAQHLQVIAF